MSLLDRISCPPTAKESTPAPFHPLAVLQINVVLYGDTVFEDLATKYRKIMEDHLLSHYNTAIFAIAGEAALMAADGWSQCSVSRYPFALRLQATRR